MFCIKVTPTYVTLEISETAVEGGRSVSFTCSTSSNPSPTLILYKQRKNQSASEVKTVTDVTLNWSDNVTSADNKAEFYCRVHDNRDIEGWDFDVQSDIQELIVWCKYNVHFGRDGHINLVKFNIKQTQKLICV